jgi:alpha-L-rhamnosidase
LGVGSAYAQSKEENSMEASPMMAGGLRCEYQVNPLGIDASPPRLSWRLESRDLAARGLRQTAYQVLAASTAEGLAQAQGDLWDTGKIVSNQQLQVAYAGVPLRSGQRVWWSVRVWDQDGKMSCYSDAAWWEMGLLSPNDWQGRWIRPPDGQLFRPESTDDPRLFEEHPAPMFRKDFEVSKPVRRARAYVSGLGYYELRLNGQKVGDHELDPGWTSYDKRVFYAVYDVTECLQAGENAVGMLVGNGWYNPLPMKMWGRFNLREALTVGPPRAILQLDVEYEDGTRESIITDETWKTGLSSILENSIYLGERYDARREQPGWDRPGFDDGAWPQAGIATEAVGTMQAQPIPPIRVTDVLEPVAVTEPSPGVFVFDLGENIAGRARLRCSGPAGTAVQMRYGELLYPDGTLNPMTAVCGQIKNAAVPEGSQAPATAWQRDTYILKGEGEESYAPRFTFHGFRYVEVTGYPGTPALDAIEGQRLHSAVTPAGTFSCSNDLFNRIQEISVRALRGNLHSVQSDCPHREKFGYGGDLVADSELGLFNFDMAAFYRKVVRDFGDAVRPNGGFTETAPYVGIADSGLGEGSGPIGWATVHPLLLWQLYQHYGEEALLREQYPAAKRWMDLLERSAKGYIIEPCIGDHESLVPKQTEVTSTAFYFYNAVLMRRLAGVLGKTQDAQRYEALSAAIREAFNRAFLDSDTGLIGIGTQANQAMALWMGLVPEEQRDQVLGALVRDIVEKYDGHLSTGIFGTKYMLMALSDLGQQEVACGIVNQRSFPGWGHMLENGATTLWEHWEFSDNTFSHNHPMFGTVSEWFFKALAGIQPANAANGFDRIVIRPEAPRELTWAKATHESIRGRILSAWRIEQGEFILEVETPGNTTAQVYVPVRGEASVQESGVAGEQAPGIQAVERIAGYAVYTIGSGKYCFRSPSAI